MTLLHPSWRGLAMYPGLTVPLYLNLFSVPIHIFCFSLAHAPAVAACFSAFAAFSRRQCLDTDLISLFSSLKRFGEGAGSGELLPLCKEIAEQLTDDDVAASSSLFPEHDDGVESDSDHSAAAAPSDFEHEVDLRSASLAGDGHENEDFDGGCGSPLAATPPAELRGASPLAFGDADDTAQMSVFSRAVPLQAVRPLPLLQQTQVFVQNYDSLDFDDVEYPSVESVAASVNIDSVFADVVSGLNAATAHAVKRAQERHKARRGDRNEQESPLEPFEGQDGVEKPASMKIVNDVADEAIAANKTIVDRLASIEYMLSKFISANGSVNAFAPSAASVRSAVDAIMRQDENATPLLSARSHQSVAAGTPVLSAQRSAAAMSPRQSLTSQHSAGVSPLLSARSHPSNMTASAQDDASAFTAASKPTAGRGNVTAAQAAATYLKSVKNNNNAVSGPSLPAIFTAPESSVRNSQRLSLSLDARQSLNAPVNRESLQRAMHAMSGQ
jgi:hypothetical protein